MSDTEWRPNRDGPWAAMSVGLLRHPKLEQLEQPRQRLLYVALVLHCADELTDGHVAPHSLPRHLLAAGAKPEDMQALANVGLVHPNSNGWTVHGYLDWNPTRAWWEHQRERNARKTQAWRERQKTHETQTNNTGNRLHNRTQPRTQPRQETGLSPGERDERILSPPNPPETLADDAKTLLERLRAQMAG